MKRLTKERGIEEFSPTIDDVDLVSLAQIRAEQLSTIRAEQQSRDFLRDSPEKMTAEGFTAAQIRNDTESAQVNGDSWAKRWWLSSRTRALSAS